MNDLEIEKIVDTLSKLTILEASKLSKILEEKWGVSPSNIINNNSSMSSGKENEKQEEEEKTEFDVILIECGNQKINVIKEVRSITNLGLKEAKNLVEGAPKAVKEGISKDEAEKFKKRLEGAGAKVELK